jgi:glycosyltransferase involved in cell wall biosynthesis
MGIPAYNEENNIAGIITTLVHLTKSIIVCDDGSSDMTAEISRNLGVIVISHDKNRGYGATINTIFQKAVEIESDVLVTFDADGQHRVEDIPKLLIPIEKKEIDVVIGSRFLKNESDVPNYRRTGIKMITDVTNASINQKLTDAQSGFRAYSKRVLTEISPSDNGMGISTEILIKASSKSLKISEVPIEILYPGNTSTHNPVSHGTSEIFKLLELALIKISVEIPIPLSDGEISVRTRLL